MTQLEQQLAKRDLNWLADFEVATVRMAYDIGLLAELRKTRDIAELAKITKIKFRVLEAVIPVVINSGALASHEVPPASKSGAPRLRALLRGGDSSLMGMEKSYSEMWGSGSIDLDSAMLFSNAMFDDSRLPAQIHCASKPFENVSTLVDLGGGGGVWAAESLATHPKLQYTIFDLDTVCEATVDVLKRKAPAAKPSYVRGNFFRDPIPAADAYLLSNILHDWTFETCRKLLTHFQRQIPDGAFLFVNECLLNEDKSGPRFASIYSLLMLLNCSAQQFSEAELSQLLQDAGFTAPKRVSNAAHYSLLVSQKKA